MGQTPFTCDGTGYLVTSRNATTTSTMRFLDANTGVLTGTTLSLTTNVILNGIGYNVGDNLIYGLVEIDLSATGLQGDIVSVDANGDVLPVGKPTNSEASANQSIPTWVVSSNGTGLSTYIRAAVGTVSNNGILYAYGVKRSDSTTYIVKVDLNSMTYSDIPVTGYNTLMINDWAFTPFDGNLYCLVNGSIYKFDNTTGECSIVVTSGVDISSVVDTGGVWTDIFGNIYFYDNNAIATGVYKLIVKTGVVERVGDSQNISRFDATACFPSFMYKEVTGNKTYYLPGDIITYKFSIYNGSSTSITGAFTDLLNTAFTWDETSITPTDIGGGTITFDGQTLKITDITIPTLVESNNEPFVFSISAIIGNDESLFGQCVPNTATFSNGILTIISIDPNTDGETNVCMVCHNAPNINNDGISTKHGITLLQRAGGDTSDTSTDWPMSRKSGHTVLESNTKGFIITRMTTDELSNIEEPLDGMLIYDTTEGCLKIYTVDDEDDTNSAWKCYDTASCP